MAAPAPAPSSTGRRARVARIRQWMADFDAQGTHRTATAGDEACADWLRAEVLAAGFQPHLDPFSLQRRDVAEAWVELDGERIEGLPLFDAPFTPPEGISGRLGPLGGRAPIGLASVPVHGPHAGLEAARSPQGAHQALLLCTTPPVPALGPRNAYAFKRPFGPPALQVSSAHEARLTAHATHGGDVRLTAHGTLTPARAYNVRVRVPGRRADLAPLLVITPRSGWWVCAGERGGGLACWLEALRGLAAARPERDVVFLATSGHEIGHYGLDAYLEAHPEQVRQALAWVHLGASIGTANTPRVQAYASDAELGDTARKLIRGRFRADRFTWHAPGETGTGEARNIAQLGGRYFSLAGRSDWFHLPCDRWPDAIDVDWLGGVTGAVAALVAELAGSKTPGAAA